MLGEVLPRLRVRGEEGGDAVMPDRLVEDELKEALLGGDAALPGDASNAVEIHHDPAVEDV